MHAAWPATGVPLSRFQVFVNPVDAFASRMFMTGPTRTGDDGTFVIRGASGPVLLRAGGAPGWYLKSVQYGGDDVTDAPIAMQPGTDVSGVRIVMSQSTTTLSGSVRDDPGKVPLVGGGMKSHPGVAAKAFETLEAAGIAAPVVSTSPIKIACHVAREDVDRAVGALHEAFGLG